MITSRKSESTTSLYLTEANRIRILQEQCCDDVCTETEYGFSINGNSNTDTGVNSFPQNNTEETDILMMICGLMTALIMIAVMMAFDNGEEN